MLLALVVWSAFQHVAFGGGKFCTIYDEAITYFSSKSIAMLPTASILMPTTRLMLWQLHNAGHTRET